MELDELNSTNQEIEKKMGIATKQISNLSYLYNSFDLNGKIRLLCSIFPEKLDFSNGKCRTPRINELLRLALIADKGLKKNKTGQLIKNLELSRVVELPGVEPEQ